MGEKKRRTEARKAYGALPPDKRLGDQPVEDSYYQQMKAIMQTLDEFMNPERDKPRSVGIVVLLTNLGSDDPRANFMSNGLDRKDIIVMFKELIARFEGQPEIKSEMKQ